MCITTYQEKIISKQLLTVAFIPAIDITFLYTLLKNLSIQSDHSRVMVLLLYTGHLVASGNLN